VKRHRSRATALSSVAVLMLMAIALVAAKGAAAPAAKQAVQRDRDNALPPIAFEGIWLFSTDAKDKASADKADLPEVLGKIEEVEETEIESRLPHFLVTDRYLGTSLWRWMAFLLLFLPAYCIAWGIAALLRKLIRTWMRWRPDPFIQDLHDSIVSPAKLVLTVLCHRIGIAIFGLPVPFRTHYVRFVAIVLTAGVAWSVMSVIDHWAERTQAAASASSSGGGSIVVLGQRFLKVLVGVVAVLGILSIAGVDITAAMAGLGLGSVVLAFAAQKTVENILGGISILSDQVIHIGDLVRIGTTIGVVEAISLRSTRIRTIDSTELSIPNGELAAMNIENLSRYDKSAFRTTLELQRETSPEQLQAVLANIRTMLHEHPDVDHDVVRVRFIGFGENGFDVEVFCLVLTGVPNEFFAIREDLLLRLMVVVSGAGTALALPSRTVYVNQDEGLVQSGLPAKKPVASDQEIAQAGQKASARH